MAKFVTEDGKDGVSGDKLYDIINDDNHSKSYTEMWLSKHSIQPYYSQVDKMKIPNGKHNRDRLLNTSIYDLLTHMQKSLLNDDLCVLKMITNENHKCIEINDTLQNRINSFVGDVDENFRMKNPKRILHIGGRGNDKVRVESDEEYRNRLNRLYINIYHSSEMKRMRCEECIQHWLNNDKW